MNRTGTRTIETQRLRLRRFTMDDAEDMYRGWACDPQVTKYLTWPAHESAEVSRAILALWIPQYEDGAFFNWAIEWKETGEAIGAMGYGPSCDCALPAREGEPICGFIPTGETVIDASQYQGEGRPICVLRLEL